MWRMGEETNELLLHIRRGIFLSFLRVNSEILWREKRQNSAIAVIAMCNNGSIVRARGGKEEGDRVVPGGEREDSASEGRKGRGRSYMKRVLI